MASTDYPLAMCPKISLTPFRCFTGKSAAGHVSTAIRIAAGRGVKVNVIGLGAANGGSAMCVGMAIYAKVD
jgi:hypothetical protein